MLRPMRRVFGALLTLLAVGCSRAAPGPTTHSAPVGVAPAKRELALTPPMGFNDWNAFGCDVSEKLIKETADFFVSSGLKDAGYTYVNIDDCWSLRERGPDGKLRAGSGEVSVRHSRVWRTTCTGSG